MARAHWPWVGQVVGPQIVGHVEGDGGQELLGKVVKARFKDPKRRRKVNKSTGEITEPKIVDPDAAEHTTGAGDKVYGLNFVMYHGRNSNENERLILGVAHAPKLGGEAKWATQAADDIIRRYPGMQALAYDGALRGTHIRKIQTTHGLPVAVPVQRRNGKPGDHDYEDVAEVRRPDGTKEAVRLHLVEGHPHLKTVDNLGDLLLVPLVHEKTARTQREDGTWRLYLTFSVPDQMEAGRSACAWTRPTRTGPGRTPPGRPSRSTARSTSGPSPG